MRGFGDINLDTETVKSMLLTHFLLAQKVIVLFEAVNVH